MKKIKIAFIFILLLTLTLEGAFSSPLMARKIAKASHNELLQMAKMRALVTELDDEEIRKALYEAEGITFDDTKVKDATKDYSLEIVNADSSTTLSNGNVELVGNIQLVFKSGNDEKLLTCNRLLFDENNKKITAFDNVVFTDKDKSKSKLGDVEADIVTFFYESENLIISGGTTETERTNNEDEKVTFYTKGDLLTYKAKDGGLVFKDGFISSNVEDSYSSISASTLALLDGGDMFLKNATLKLGRVPLVYMPIFFYPGSTLAGNPAFGFNSDRGMFVSTTWEIFGKNKELEKEGESSSFSALLRSTDDGKMVSNGLYYRELEDGEELGGIDAWADKSSSFFSISADVYEKAGLYLGADGAFNTSTNLLKSETHSGIALSPRESSDKSKFRYYSTNDLKLNSAWANLTLDLPFYSDPEVIKDYRNRITSFAFTSILGEEQTFPTNYNTAYTSYALKMSGDVKLPSKYSTSYVKNLSFSNINATVQNRWDTKEMEYYMEKVILPSLRFSASGTFFEVGSRTLKSSEEKSETVNETESFILENSLLRPLYEEQFSKTSQSVKGSYLSLGYAINSSFSNEYDKRTIKDEKFSEELSSENKVVLTLDGGVKDYFTFKDVVTPIYNYKNVKEKSESKDTTLLSSLNLSSPFLGLEYNLNNRLYRKQISIVGEKVSEKELAWFTFDKESVTAHNISIKRDIKIDSAVLTPKLSYTLPPLKTALTPSLSFSGYGFLASFSWAFVGDEYKSDKINMAFGYTGPYFLFSTNTTYDTAKEKKSWYESLTCSFSTTLQTKDKKYSVSESLKWLGNGNEITSLKTTINIPTLSIGLDLKTIDDKLKMNYLSLEERVKNALFTFWKNRIGIAFAIDSKLYYDFNNKYNSYLTFSPALIFKIQEFLDLKVSYTMKNDSFYKYESVKDVFDDLKASLDFIGNGRKQTRFIMNSMAFELVHYMQDWNLTARYNADVVYQGGYYQWVPSFSIFLKWKTMPDLKVDENWRYINNEWMSTGPSK